MFEELPFGISASSQTRAGLVALFAHVLVIVTAVYATERPTAVTRASADTVRIQLSPARRPDETSPTGPARHHPSLPSAPTILAVPPQSHTPTIPGLDISPAAPGLDAVRSLVTGERAALDVRALGSTAPSVSAVDELPTLQDDLAPRYPEQLRALGLTGEVLVEYVVNAEGRVARSSLRIVHSPHPAFSQAVIEALVRARFNPARVGGRSVAVLVQQKIRFEAGLH
jgi:periplasmic protein TonB